MSFFNTIPGDGSIAILLYGDVGEGQKVESGRVVSELLTLQGSYPKIDVRINSNGGDVFSGIAIYNALRTSTADITIYVDGVAASIAGIIALCGKPLYMSPYAKLMLHSVSGGMWGNASALRQTASVMETLQGDLAQMIAKRCGMGAEEVAKRYFDERDHWISAEEAVRMRLADGIYELPDAPRESPGTTEEIYNFFNNRLHGRPQNNEDMALIDKMKSIPSLGDASDEQEIVDRVRSLVNKATKAEALEAANASYKARIEEAETKVTDAILAKAVGEGKITQEQVPQLKALMKADRASTEALIAGMKPKSRRMVSGYIDENGEPAALWSGKSWDEIDRMGKLSELKSATPTLFAEKFKEKFGVDYKE